MLPKAEVFLYEDCIIKTIRAIWDASAATISRTEKDHKNSINFLWGSYIPGYDASSNDDIYEKYNLAISHEIFYHKKQSSIISAYTSLIFAHYSIEEIWSSEKIEKHKKSNFEFINFYEKNLSTEIKNETYFIDEIIPAFFRLMHKKMQLDHLLSLPKGIPSSQATRVNRASKAAQSKNFGESILKNRILSFLKSQNIKKEYTSVPKILSDLSEEIGIIFNDYRDSMNHSSKAEGRNHFFGKDSDLINIEKTIRRWINYDDDFHDAIQRICLRKVSLRKRDRDKSLLDPIKK